MSERWAPIPGTRHEASDLGRIRSLVRKRPVILAQHRARKRKYLTTHVEGRTIAVHRLVMWAFVGPRPEGMQVRHLNGISTDNRLANLAYGTPSENMRDKLIHGTNHQVNKVECPQGHEYSPENTIWIKGGTARRCRICHTKQSREAERRYVAATYERSLSAITPGQVWADTDHRTSGRTVRVLNIGDTHVECALVTSRDGALIRGKRTTRVKLEHFSKDYRLIDTEVCLGGVLPEEAS